MSSGKKDFRCRIFGAWHHSGAEGVAGEMVMTSHVISMVLGRNGWGGLRRGFRIWPGVAPG